MSRPLIASIQVERLFGLYSYQLPKDSHFSDANILYGDNGVGKSTILRLAFHLLSSAPNRGQRSFLYKTDFKFLEVQLVSGATVSATKSVVDNTAHLALRIAKEGRDIALWDYVPRNARGEWELLHEYTHEGVLGRDDFELVPSLKVRQITSNRNRVTSRNSGNAKSTTAKRPSGSNVQVVEGERPYRRPWLSMYRLLSYSMPSVAYTATPCLIPATKWN
jgi:hypothetical protein